MPEPVDLAVVVVPAAQAIDVVKDCGKAGVKALLVLSAGFAEAGEEGIRLQEKLRRRVRRAGMRVVGPNSFGLINNDPSVRLNATLASVIPESGRLGLFAQSGALGVAVLASAARRGLGISVFASAGNRVDVSGNDLMQYWIDDQETDTVGLYLESMGNPRKFSRIARALAAVKPVVVVSSGVSSFAAPPGHRTRVTNVPPQAFDALLRQAGVIRVENVHQLFDVAQLTLHQPLPKGDRVAIVGNSDALGALSASACVSWGLKVTHGPVSLPPQASAEEFAAALDAAFADPEVDSVVAAFIPPLVTQDEEVHLAVRTIVADHEKPCVATFLGMRGVGDGLAYEQNGIRRSVPAYSMPEDGIRALNAVTRYALWRQRDRGTQVAPVGHRPRARRVAPRRPTSPGSPEGRALTRDEARELLGAYGIRVWPAVEVSGVDAAVPPPTELTYPVILKSTSPVVRHQPGLVGVRGDLVDAEAVRDAHASLTQRLGPLGADRFVVQRMAVPGVSCVIRASEDPLFGPVVSFSVAGPPTELLGDVAHRIPPLTDVDVTDLIDGVKAAPLLSGHRGAAPVHRAALADLIARLSVLADDHPELSSVELNPVNAWTGGVDVLGAEVVVRPAPRAQGPRSPPDDLTARTCGPLGGVHAGAGARMGVMRRVTPGTGRALPEDLTEAITRAGYYPSLVCDVVESAIADDEVVSHLVHQETTFDHETVRRHVTVLVVTPLPSRHRPRRRPCRVRGQAHGDGHHRDGAARGSPRRHADPRRGAARHLHARHART